MYLFIHLQQLNYNAIVPHNAKKYYMSKSVNIFAVKFCFFLSDIIIIIINFYNYHKEKFMKKECMEKTSLFHWLRLFHTLPKIHDVKKFIVIILFLFLFQSHLLHAHVHNVKM